MSEGQTCDQCRFRVAKTPRDGIDRVMFARCGWVDHAQDEAGDRMPIWAWEIVAHHREAYGPNDRAEDCPAFEVRP